MTKYFFVKICSYLEKRLVCFTTVISTDLLKIMCYVNIDVQKRQGMIEKVQVASQNAAKNVP